MVPLPPVFEFHLMPYGTPVRIGVLHRCKTLVSIINGIFARELARYLTNQLPKGSRSATAVEVSPSFP